MRLPTTVIIVTAGEMVEVTDHQTRPDIEPMQTRERQANQPEQPKRKTWWSKERLVTEPDANGTRYISYR